MPTAEDGWGWAGPQPSQGHLGHPIRSPWVGWSRQGSEEGGEPRDGCPDSIPMSNEQQMSHRLSRAVEIIKEHEKEYPEERNRFRLAEASWTPRIGKQTGRGKRCGSIPGWRSLWNLPMPQPRCGPSRLTVRVDAVQGGGGDDGHFVLPQGAPLAELLLAGTVHLGAFVCVSCGTTRSLTVPGGRRGDTSLQWLCTRGTSSPAVSARCRRSGRRRHSVRSRAGSPPATGGAWPPTGRDNRHPWATTPCTQQPRVRTGDAR